VWKNAFSVQIESGTLNVGDRISIEFPVDFNEQVVASLQLDDVNVKTAAAGQEIGILRDQASGDLKEGFSVYRVRPA
jgi:GTPase